VAGVGVIVAVLNLLLTRSGREEQGMMTTLAGLIVVIMVIIKEIGNVFTLIRSTFGF
jgi:stage III sporulation protein AC